MATERPPLRHGILSMTLLFTVNVVGLAAQAPPPPSAWSHFVDSAQHAWTGPDSRLLSSSERGDFTGVRYFDYDASFALPAAYRPILGADTIAVPTTRGRTSRYLPIATVEFAIADTSARLTVYRGLDPWSAMDTHFLMFRDASNGAGSYPGGRYLELEEVDEAAATATVDFNFAYNPYCAYSPRYSCPVPPAGNEVPVRIDAGAAYGDPDRRSD